MVISKIHPVHAINKYLWHQIETVEQIMNKADYSGIIPLVPVKEATELMTIIDAQAGIKSLPYIVYTWTKIPSGPTWFMKTHEIAYAVRTADPNKMGQLINLFDKLFQSYDEAAIRINEYIQANGTVAQKRYQFKYFSVQTLGGELPAERENGVDESLITIRAAYVEN